MNLYLLKRPDGDFGYDEYFGDVVAADTPERAFELSNLTIYEGVTTTLIGKADKRIEEGVVLSDFNAG